MKKFLCVGVVIPFFFFFVSAQSLAPEWNNKKVKVKEKAGIRAFAFDLKDVHLLESPFKKAMEADVNYLLVIDPDRLLSNFRAHANLQPKAPCYGGWESEGLAGHTLGHYLSACSMAYASTGNKEFKRRVSYMVDQLEETQLARKTGYLGAIPGEDSMWAAVAKGSIRSRGFDLNGAWSPWYTVHKIMAGLLDAYLYCDNEKALKVETGMADWAYKTTKDLNDSLMQKMLVTEYGGMNEVLANTYAITGNKKYFDLSYRFHDRRILDSLAMQRDILPGKHSNTQIPKVIGTVRRYQLTGNEKDFDIADFFWQTVVYHHSYATGGNSNYEYLGDADKLNDKLTDNTTETCNTYNMLKLTRQLFFLHPSARLMDYYERALYNHILASQRHRDGMMTYFVSLRMGGKKEYSDSFNTFTCCVGSGMENHVKYGESIYFRGSDGSLYINLFIPSELNWKENQIKIKQETNIPSGNTTMITFTTAKARSFPIRIRKPQWADHVQVKINGQWQNPTPDSQGYLVLKRKWNDHDTIEFITPEHFYTVPIPDNPNRKALFYGPDLLAGILGDKEPQPNDIPVFVSSSTDPATWIKTENPGLLQFETAGVALPKEVRLIPFNQTADEYYTVYWDVFTPQQWSVQQKKYEEEKNKRKELEDKTVDVLRVGEMQPERDHNFTGEKMFTADDHNRKWRMAAEGGYFSFTMKVDPNENNTLICTYWGEDNRGRIFDVFLGDIKVATEDLTHFKMNRFYDVGYPIPKELTTGKTDVTLKFVPRKNNSVGPVYGIRMVKGEVSSLLTPLTNESIYK